MPKVVKIAVLVSGGGSNLEALLQASEAGRLPDVQFVSVIASKSEAYALKRAGLHHIPSVVVDPRRYADADSFEAALLKALDRSQADLICLAGFLRKIGHSILQRFQGRILNIHPALLPKFGGSGMYGHHVHEAVIAAKEKESGCSVHLVDGDYDHGRVLGQARVPVFSDDTADTLAERVLLQEHLLYPKILREFCEKLIGVQS